jgi:hypothetical protein
MKNLLYATGATYASTSDVVLFKIGVRIYAMLFAVLINVINIHEFIISYVRANIKMSMQHGKLFE